MEETAADEQATTTSPFTCLDLAVYSDMSLAFLGLAGARIPTDPEQVFFNGQTRQYINMSHAFRFVGPRWFASQLDMVCGPSASLLLYSGASPEHHPGRARSEVEPSLGLRWTSTWRPSCAGTTATPPGARARNEYPI